MFEHESCESSETRERLIEIKKPFDEVTSQGSEHRLVSNKSQSGLLQRTFFEMTFNENPTRLPSFAESESWSKCNEQKIVVEKKEREIERNRCRELKAQGRTGNRIETISTCISVRKSDVQSTSWMGASCCVNPDRYTTHINVHLLFLAW